MGKRSNFVRRERDSYFTPQSAVEPLIPHLPEGSFTYLTPCVGDGRMISHLSLLTEGRAQCTYFADLEPQMEGAVQADALKGTPPKGTAEIMIENPPWDRKFLHPFIDLWLPLQPMWLLFDANWMFTKQAKKYLPYCQKIVTIGRVKWIEGSKMTGKDDSCWYLFDYNNTEETKFYGRQG